MIHETRLQPGVGVGNIRLGQSMYETIQHLSQHNYRLRVNYSEKDHLQHPLYVTLVDYQVRLSFTNNGPQLLQLIEILDLPMADRTDSRKPLSLVYQGSKINEYESVDLPSAGSSFVPTSNTTLRLIYNKLFGPTYPGQMVGNVYILSYPGIAFKFVLASPLLEKVQAADDEKRLSILLNWDADHEISCSSIAIFRGESWDNREEKEAKAETEAEKTEVEKKGNDKKNPEATFFKVELDKGLVHIDTHKGNFTVEIGVTSQQEILHILGPPDDYFTKVGSPLLIHGSLARKAHTETGAPYHKFHNYFRYGLDVMYDAYPQKGPKVKKLVLHNGGLTESLNFMKWNRCNWQVLCESVCFDSSMNFLEMPEQLRMLVPVLLNRTESEYVNNDLDIIDPPDYAEPSGKVKTWGQSRLYGYKRCIFEVLDSNGFVSCLTVF